MGKSAPCHEAVITLKNSREPCSFSVFGSYLRIYLSVVYEMVMVEVVKLTESCYVTNDLRTVKCCSWVHFKCLCCKQMAFGEACLLNGQVDLSQRT